MIPTLHHATIGGTIMLDDITLPEREVRILVGR